MYDVVIIGGGPAAVAAGVYAARKKLKSAVVADAFGGQSLVSSDIQNWIGTKSVSGLEFAKMLEDHLRAQEAIDIINDFVIKVDKSGNNFKIYTKSEKIFDSRTILVASGSRRRKLNVPGEKELEGRGVSYCSTCDAPLFKDKITAVIGGGNAGLEAVLDLLAYSPKIYLLEYSDKLKGDPMTQDKIKADKRVEIILRAKVSQILGEKFVSGLQYEDLTTGKLKELMLDGIFVEIGSVPNSDFVKDLVQTNQYGEIVVNPKTQQTSQAGIWAAGDVCDVLYKQNNIAAGDAIKAILNIVDYLNQR